MDQGNPRLAPSTLIIGSAPDELIPQFFILRIRPRWTDDAADAAHGRLVPEVPQPH